MSGKVAGPEVRAFCAVLGRAIRAARELKGLKQGALGEMAGISQNHLSSIELGRDVPSLAVLVPLAAALDVPLWRLFRAAENVAATRAMAAKAAALREGEATDGDPENAG